MRQDESEPLVWRYVRLPPPRPTPLDGPIAVAWKRAEGAPRRRDRLVSNGPDAELADLETSDGDDANTGFSDAELTALALAADPDRPVDVDAVPLGAYLDQAPAPLPEWYMPPVTARRGRRWRTVVVLAIVVAFLVIEAVGLCSTYGPIVPA